jgi:hypothetical protein
MAGIPGQDGGHDGSGEPGRLLGESRRHERAEFLTDSIGDQIRQLILHRLAAYARARTYRRDGQLVPGSLRDDIADNARQLRQALDGYSSMTQARGNSDPAAGRRPRFPDSHLPLGSSSLSPNAGHGAATPPMPHRRLR